MLGLPWPKWGETAATLLRIGAELDAARCPCGCRQWRDQAHDPGTEGQWIVETVECYARKALVRHADATKSEPHVLAGVRLDTGEGHFDPTLAARLHADHQSQIDQLA